MQSGDLAQQEDRMFITEATITIKQNKKTERVTSIQWKVDRALSYNGAKTATHKHSLKCSATNGQAKGAVAQLGGGRTEFRPPPSLDLNMIMIVDYLLLNFLLFFLGCQVLCLTLNV